MIASETDRKMNFVILNTEKAAIASVEPAMPRILFTTALNMIDDTFLNAVGAPSFMVSARYFMFIPNFP